MSGLLIAFEGLDQSGKQTQAELLRDRLVDQGRMVRLLSFPAYNTHIGTEIGKALQGDRQYGSDVMQLLYVANRYELKPEIVRELEQSGISQGKICLFTNSGNNRFWDGTSSFDESSGGSHHDRVEHYLTTNGVPRDDAHAYAEGVRRGHALIAVRCDDDEVDRVVDILDNDNVLDLDERQDASVIYSCLLRDDPIECAVFIAFGVRVACG